jgi:2-amino-4-hydroxy-6-hydroxymethyldihydropteridine diphosphokinase
LSLRAVVGFGSNLGDRLATMREAVRRLEQVAVVEATSHVYETAPVGPPQPDYLNAAALVTWNGTPSALMETLLSIEADLGRARTPGERNAPRTIDLDVLWIEGLRVESPQLVVPHPRLTERAFALVPMLEVVPGATDPTTGRAYVVAGEPLRPSPALL